jgi:hypothetical protein
MLAMNMAIVQVINMVAVQHRCVSTPWAVGVTVLLSLCVSHHRHGVSLSGEHLAYMRSFNVEARFGARVISIKHEPDQSWPTHCVTPGTALRWGMAALFRRRTEGARRDQPS